jgi:hypothetical protein
MPPSPQYNLEAHRKVDVPIPPDPALLQTIPLNDVTNTDKQKKDPNPDPKSPSAKSNDAIDEALAKPTGKANPIANSSDDPAQPKWIKDYQRNLHKLFCTSVDTNVKNRELVEKALLVEKIFSYKVRFSPAIDCSSCITKSFNRLMLWDSLQIINHPR